MVAAIGMAARGGQRPDPCAAATFNETACQAAIQDRGYCWNGKWIRFRYHYPFPYYYDAYQEYLASGGAVTAAMVDSCGPGRRGGFVSGAHAVSRAGFGSKGACHAAHG